MSMTPLVNLPGCRVVLPPVYCGSVERYAAMARAEGVTIDTSLPYNPRQKSLHRTIISGCNGLQRLTVPLRKCRPGTPLDRVMVSPHNEWWTEHRTAIASAYGRTPYYEFYADELMPAFTGEVERLVDLLAIIDRFCRRVLLIPADDAGEELAAVALPEVTSVPYRQIWAERMGGFTPGLSALDLIFNLGPEAPLVLKAMGAVKQ